MVAVVLLAEHSCELALCVFDFVPLVDDDVFPVVFVESESVLEDEVVGGDADVPLGALHLLQNLVSGGGISAVYDFPYGGRPLVELRHPVRNRR